MPYPGVATANNAMALFWHGSIMPKTVKLGLIWSCFRRRNKHSTETSDPYPGLRPTWIGIEDLSCFVGVWLHRQEPPGTGLARYHGRITTFFQPLAVRADVSRSMRSGVSSSSTSVA